MTIQLPVSIIDDEKLVDVAGNLVTTLPEASTQQMDMIVAALNAQMNIDDGASAGQVSFPFDAPPDLNLEVQRYKLTLQAQEATIYRLQDLVGSLEVQVAQAKREMRDACAKLCKDKAREFYERPARWQHHTGAATGCDLCADEIQKLEA